MEGTLPRQAVPEVGLKINSTLNRSLAADLPRYLTSLIKRLTSQETVGLGNWQAVKLDAGFTDSSGVTFRLKPNGVVSESMMSAMVSKLEWLSISVFLVMDCRVEASHP